MTRVIECDADMPRSLSTAAKQEAKAKQVASTKYAAKTKKVRAPQMQGSFSRTRIVTLKDGTDVVVQFRIEPLNVAYMEKTRKLLGPVVPQIGYISDPGLEKEEVWTYVMSLIPGSVWALIDEEGIELPALKSLGTILARGQVNSDSTTIVDTELTPKLHALKACTNKAVTRFAMQIDLFLEEIDKLKVLPLFISHFDLNQTNIIIDDNGAIQGIIDWELAADRPFGFGFHRIHDLAGFIAQGVFHIPLNYEELERGFWEALLAGLAPDVRLIVMSNLEAVQMALHLGSLLFAFELGQEQEYDEDDEKRLTQFLSYRLPMIRGDDPPYGVDV